MNDNVKKSQELSDEQLEKVAGGEGCGNSSTTGGRPKIKPVVPGGSSSNSSFGHYSSSSSIHR
ncbi:MAG: hypothetical protein EXS36_10800 [Pedosphaera sp.]|nr:hypothetical protein [Pedosphaera sp.]